MGSFSIWHWGIVAGIVVVPTLITALVLLSYSRSKKKQGRQ